MKKKIRYWS